MPEHMGNRIHQKQTRIENKNKEIISCIYILGAFGNVKYAWLKDNCDAKFAIKAMKKKEIIDSKHVDHIENEKKILEILEHPFIVGTRSQRKLLPRT